MRRGPVRRLPLLIVLGALSAFAPLATDMYLPALPALSDDLDASASLTQLSLTTCLLGLALGQIFAGPVSDRRGRRPVLLLGIAGFFVASALCAAAPNAEVLLALRFVQGAAGAFGLVIARAIVRDLYSGVEMSRVFSRLMLVTGIAPLLGPILGAELLRFTSWRGTFVALAAIGLVILIATAVVLPETLRPELRSTGGVAENLRAFRRIAYDRAFLVYTVTGALAFGVMFAYFAGSPFVLQDLYGASPLVFSLIFALNVAGAVAVGQVNAHLVGRTSLQRLLRLGLLVAAAGATAVFLAVSAGSGLGLAALVPALLVAISPVGMVMPNSSALALAGYARAAGAASALLGTIQFLLGAAVSPLVGAWGKGTAVPMGAVMACQALLALGVLLVLDRPGRETVSPRDLTEESASWDVAVAEDLPWPTTR